MKQTLFTSKGKHLVTYFTYFFAAVYIMMRLLLK
jgi:hypothetical protein